MKISTLLRLVSLLLCSAGSVLFGQDVASLRWDCKRVHFTRAEASAYDAWVITPPEPGSTTAQPLPETLEIIFREQNPRVAYIELSDLIRRPELQTQVMSYVSAQPEFQHEPPPTGFGRWDFKHNYRKRVLISQGLLHSQFVADCNALLTKHGKAVKSVSMEKLFFTKKDGQWGWDAIVWLEIDPPPGAMAK